MKAIPLALCLFALSVAPSFAGCTQSLEELDAALKASEIKPETKAQLADMRTQAANLCAAGNEDEAADVIAEAEAIIAGPGQ